MAIEFDITVSIFVPKILNTALKKLKIVEGHQYELNNQP